MKINQQKRDYILDQKRKRIEAKKLDEARIIEMEREEAAMPLHELAPVMQG